MITINKDFKAVPASLKRDLVQQKREELLEHGGYLNENKYNDWYKKPDVKAALIEVYHYKCAFCEQKVEQFQVEHFRPKSIYYWLAFSWDNLLCACPTCNIYKNNHFETLKARIVPKTIVFEKIHELAPTYDKLEQNLFVNPELEQNIQSRIVFSLKTGEISSIDPKLQYTIDKCQLNRQYLKDNRLEIFNDFKEKMAFRRFEKVSTKPLIQDFLQDAKSPKKEFLAFRRFVVSSFKEKK